MGRVRVRVIRGGPKRRVGMREGVRVRVGRMGVVMVGVGLRECVVRVLVLVLVLVQVMLRRGWMRRLMMMLVRLVMVWVMRRYQVVKPLLRLMLLWMLLTPPRMPAIPTTRPRGPPLIQKIASQVRPHPTT
jgi:hypothetical protein